MTNFIEHNDSIAFHPGYYITELIEDSGMSQEDFAKRLSTTPKNLSLLIRGEQSLSVDMAMKLSRMLGTSPAYWLNLQNAFDTACAEAASQNELKQEEEVLKVLGYSYFRDKFGLPDLPRKLEEQVVQVRLFLRVASLTVLNDRDLAVSFRGTLPDGDAGSVIKANAMVQIAANKALEEEAPKFRKEAFKAAVGFALKQTGNHEGFYPIICEAFREAGVILVGLPNLPGSRVNGASKRVGSRVLLMVNDRRHYADAFWFTLLHEAGHILNGDFGVSFDKEAGDKEEAADKFARDSLIDPDLYSSFVRGAITRKTICAFAERINRDPGIVIGRLQNDGFVGHNDQALNSLKHKYEIIVSC